MKKIIAQEQNAWLAEVDKWVLTKKEIYLARSLYLPAGETPKAIYRNWQLNNPSFLKELNLIQIDDVISGPRKNLFKKFFFDELPAWAGRIEYFDRGQTQADLGILGIGLNGHVAFHEPGLPTDFYSGCVRLTETTLKNLSLEPNSWGQTYGVGAFKRCKALLIIVKGPQKKEILDKIVRQSEKLPAAALLSHPDLTILSDFEF